MVCFLTLKYWKLPNKYICIRINRPQNAVKDTINTGNPEIPNQNKTLNDNDRYTANVKMQTLI